MPTLPRLVPETGGYANYPAHFGKADLISPENLRLSMVDMQKKWALYKHLKENYTREDLVERIGRGVQKMIDQKVTYCRTLVDADQVIVLSARREHPLLGITGAEGLVYPALSDEDNQKASRGAISAAALQGQTPADRPATARNRAPGPPLHPPGGQGPGGGPGTGAAGVFRAVIFVEEDDGEAKLHACLPAGTAGGKGRRDRMLA